MLHLFRAFLFTLLIFSSFALRATGGYTNGFIPNRGQWPSAVEYRMSIPSGAAFLEKHAITYVLYDGEALKALHDHHHDKNEVHEQAMIRHHALRMNFIGSNEVVPVANHGGATKYNYYLGKDRRKWASGLQAYQDVTYPGFYAGTDLKVYSNAHGLKYDFILQPGANPDLIQFNYEGADQVSLINGQLRIQTSLGEMIEQAPVAWQVVNGEKIPVECAFTFNQGRVGFTTGNYNPALELIIDPQIIFATYSGADSDNWGFTATYDNWGNGYSGGIVFGANFPTQTGSYQLAFGGGQLDIGILKYTPDGTSALFVTYLGGSDMELPHSMIVNEYDELLVYGTTGSNNFPVTSGAFSTEFQGGPATSFENGFISIDFGLDLFVTRFSADGSSLLASTYVGGTNNDGLNSGFQLVANYADEIRGSLWVDSDNNVYVGTSTQSSDFPVTSNAFQLSYGGGSQDGVVIKLDGNLSNIQWASYLGGADDDGIFYLTVDQSQNVIVTGGTVSLNFPTTTQAYQPNPMGGVDGFVTKIDSTGNVLIASSYIGSDTYDQSYIVGTDNNSNVYLFGQTGAFGDEFVINSPIGITGGNQFLSKLEPDLSGMVWSTTFGNATGQPDISPTALLVDVCDKIYVTGWGGNINSFGTTTFGLPTTSDAFQSTTDGNDFYLYVIDNNALSVEYASFLGGGTSLDHVDGGTSRFDRKGVIYQSICAGCGGLSDLPVTPGAFSPTNNAANCNNALVKFDFESPITVSAFVNANDPVGCAPYEVNFENTSVNADIFSWRLGNQEIGNSQNLTYIFESAGVYEVTLIASSTLTCNASDTVSITITVLSNIEGSLPDLEVCRGTEVTLGPDGFTDPYYTFQWTPAVGLSDDGVKKPLLTVDSNATYTLVVSIGACSDTLVQQITTLGGSRETLPPVSVCALDSIQIGLDSPYPGTPQYNWSPSSNQLVGSNTYNPTFFAEESQDFILTVELQSGCIDTFDVSVEARFEAFDAGPDVEACAGLPAQLGYANPGGNFEYVWTPSTGLSDATLPNPIATVTENTVYSLYRVPGPNETACPGTDELIVTIVEQPLALFGVDVSGDCGGVSVQLRDSSIGYDSLLWIVSNGITFNNPDTVFTFPYADTLTITLIASKGECRDTMSFAEYIDGLKAYYDENESNVFSPNGDGLNDCFSPALQLNNNLVNTKFLPCSDLLVYDRWGKIVFDSSTEGDNSCWDGKNKAGEDMPESVYYYIYIFDAQERAGIVHLKRE